MNTTYQKDKNANKANKKGRFIVRFFRIAHFATSHDKKIVRLVLFPILKLYNWIVIWLLGTEIPAETRIGAGLQIWHGYALVINPEVVIGENALLRHCTTIGNKYLGSRCPRIGNNVEIGAHCVIIGDIEIGDNVTVGAGSVVTKSIPNNHIAYGNPLVIKRK